MTDYTELVKALRCCAENFGCPIECPRYSPADEGVRACVSRLEKDAAAAIEALEAKVEKTITLEQAIDRLRELGWLQEHDRILSQPHWVSVEDELPNDGEWAIFTNGNVVSVERFKEDAYNHFYPASQWFDFEDAIAWMPLPEPPKEDE